MITFDTLKFVETLQASGIPETQAKAMAAAFREAQGEADWVNKRDPKELELKLTSELTALKGDMTLIKWMLGLVVVAEVVPWLAKWVA